MTSLLNLLHLDYDEDDSNEGIPHLFEQSHYYNNEEVTQILTEKQNVFNLFSLNCQSLCSKFDQLQLYVEYFNKSTCSFSVICLQETWLSADHDISLLQLNGYKFIYKPKLSSLHGGVAFYIKDSLEFRILPSVVNDEICDSLFIEISLSSLRLLYLQRFIFNYFVMF